MSDRKCWAFLVGINKYKGYTRLRYCVQDVQTLEILLDNVGYVPVCLHDYLVPDHPRYPSRVNILHELEALLDNVNTQDLLLVYFACHGVRTPEGKPMLIAADTRKKRLEESGISILDDLEPLIRNSRAQQKVLMLDACFMGQGRGQQDPTEFLKKVNELASGFEVISASSEDQEALESSGLNHSIFCHFVLKGLAGEAEMGQKVVMLSALKRYVMAEIAEYTVRLSIEQSPQGRSDGNLGDFMLVDYTAHSLPSLESLSIPDIQQVSPQDFQARSETNEPKSIGTRLIESLWTLDYTNQVQLFESRIPRMRRGAVVAVRAENELLQSWLTKRLLKKLPIPVNNFVDACAVISASDVLDNFETFWDGLGKHFKVNTSLRSVDRDASQMIIETIIKKYQSENIIIVIKNWPRRSGLRKRVPELLCRILNDFWYPLQTEMRAQKVAPLRQRLVLCLMDAGRKTNNLQSLKNENPNLVDLIDLSPLNITSDELTQWVISNQWLPDIRKDDDYVDEFLKDLSEPGMLENAEEVINDICDLFKVNLVDIEAEWRWAG